MKAGVLNFLSFVKCLSPHLEGCVDGLHSRLEALPVCLAAGARPAGGSAHGQERGVESNERWQTGRI